MHQQSVTGDVRLLVKYINKVLVHNNFILHDLLYQIVDANVNRVSEGLRVIEDYVRFVKSHAKWSKKLASLVFLFF